MDEDQIIKEYKIENTIIEIHDRYVTRDIEEINEILKNCAELL